MKTILKLQLKLTIILAILSLSACDAVRSYNVQIDQNGKIIGGVTITPKTGQAIKVEKKEDGSISVIPIIDAVK